jgi:nucleoside-diphosphate-sugar epimerase
MRIFVAGATGVVGRRAVPLLLERGHRVTAVGRTPEKRAALQREGADALALDLPAPAGSSRSRSHRSTPTGMTGGWTRPGRSGR